MMLAKEIFKGILVATAATATVSFDLQHFRFSGKPQVYYWQLAFSASTVEASSFEEWIASKRNVEDLSDWASSSGIQMENSFHLVKTTTVDTSNNNDNNDNNDDNDDWNVELTQSAEEADRILFIPYHMILSGSKIEKDLSHVNGLEQAKEYIEKRNCVDQLPQYFLWVKILQEWENGSHSLWYEWIQSLPREFSNALYLDEVELECLPPYAWSLAKLELLHLEVFQEALRMMPSVVSRSTLESKAMARWALSVVFTRCWGQDTEENGNFCHIAPVGDMLNHAENATTFLDYDKKGNCNIFLKRDIEKGTALSLSYGRTTNPSRFLVLYGFVDTQQKEIFSQLLATNPSQRHKDMGYDVSKMVISTIDGTISEQNFDVSLYSILEQSKDEQEQFYNAHTKGDVDVARKFREKYHLEVCIVLKRHVDGKLAEIGSLLQKMDNMYSENIVQRHPRLPAIYQHNKFLYFTFLKAKQQVDQMIKTEMKRRQKNA